MKPDLLPRGLRGAAHFRWRGGDVSRIEGLSDGVFALSLTLLVVALEVPRTSGQLIALVWQFPAFALCFAFLLWVWYQHFLFHRRYGFEDAATVALNGLLLPRAPALAGFIYVFMGPAHAWNGIRSS